MGRKCLVPWCKSSRPLHIFPRDAARAKLWLSAIGWPLTTDTSKLVVCSNHFSRESFENWRLVDFGLAHKERLRLEKDAVPISISTNAVMKDFPLLAPKQSSETKSTQTPERIQANPESDKLHAKTIIDIDSAFALWQKFRDENGFKTDTELAFYLLSRTACCADLSARHKKRKVEPLTDVPTHLKMEECESDSSQPRNGHHCTDEDMKVPEICYEVPPPYQTDEPAEIETRSEDQIKSESQIKLEDQSAAPALNNEDIIPESSTSAIKNEIKEEPVETEVQPENRLEVSMDSVTTSDKITPSFVQTVNPVAVKEEHTEEPLVPNKTHFTGLFRTCIQCGEPMQEYTTVSSGSLNQLQWKCSNGHLMCLFSNNNPTQTNTSELVCIKMSVF